MYTRGAWAPFLWSDLRYRPQTHEEFPCFSWKGFFRCLPGKPGRSGQDVLVAVLDLMADTSGRREETFLATLVDRCIFGMSRSHQSIWVQCLIVREGSVTGMAKGSQSEMDAMPLVADDADETEDPAIPWTIHVANAMVKVSLVLLNQLLCVSSRC